MSFTEPDPDETQPTPEELDVLQKFCKHLSFEEENSIEFLKVGENRRLRCCTCNTIIEMTVDWKAYVYIDYEGEQVPAGCEFCGGYIFKGREIKEGSGFVHDYCMWDTSDDEW